VIVRRVEIQPTIEETALIEKLPKRALSEPELRDFIVACTALPAVAALAAERGIRHADLFEGYRRIANAVALRAGSDPRLAAVCLLRWHVLSSLLDRGFAPESIEDLLDHFAEWENFCQIRHERVTRGALGAVAAPAPAALYEDAGINSTLQELDDHFVRNQYDEVEQQATLLIDMSRAQFGTAHPYALLMLGRSLLKRGLTRQADPLLREALEVASLSLQAGGTVLTLAAIQFLARLDLAKVALELVSAEAACSIMRAAFGELLDRTVGASFTQPGDDGALKAGWLMPVLHEGLEGAAWLYQQLGQREVAALIARSALLLGAGEARDRQRSLQILLFRIHRDLGNHAEADEAFRLADEIGHLPAMERLLQAMALLERGLRAEASTLVDQVHATAGADDPHLPDLAVALGELAVAEGKSALAADWFAHAVELSDRYLERLCTRLSDFEMQSQAARHAQYEHRLLEQMLVEPDDGPPDINVVALAFSAVLRRRHLALDFHKHVMAARGADPQTHAALLALRQRLGSALLLDRSSIAIDSVAANAIAERDALEARLAAAAGPCKIAAADLQALSRALPPGVVLIEYVDLPACPPFASRRQERRYVRVAFWLFNGSLGYVVLSDPTAIDTRVELWLEQIRTESSDATETGEALRAAMLDPVLLRLRLEEVRSLQIVATGALAAVPFGALPVADECLLQSLEVTYLTTGRDLLRPRRAQSGYGPPVVIAGPDFQAGARPEDEFWERLPGAQAEGEEIADLLGVTPVTGARATETFFQRLASPLILHVATHGYFQNRGLKLPGGTEEPSQACRRAYALRGAGLVFAGANAYLGGCEVDESFGDCIATYEDVAGIDLSGTRLAVLSACDVGRGTLDASEGVIGLRRAFVAAGAGTLIMSLWPVPDEDCRELMRHFYLEILAGARCGFALRNAQLKLVDRGAHVSAYGGFICVGDSGALDLAARESLRSGRGQITGIASPS